MNSSIHKGLSQALVSVGSGLLNINSQTSTLLVRFLIVFKRLSINLREDIQVLILRAYQQQPTQLSPVNFKEISLPTSPVSVQLFRPQLLGEAYIQALTTWRKMANKNRKEELQEHWHHTEQEKNKTHSRQSSKIHQRWSKSSMRSDGVMETKPEGSRSGRQKWGKEQSHPPL